MEYTRALVIIEKTMVRLIISFACELSCCKRIACSYLPEPIIVNGEQIELYIASMPKSSGEKKF